jgi:hypothetical protein
LFFVLFSFVAGRPLNLDPYLSLSLFAAHRESTWFRFFSIPPEATQFSSSGVFKQNITLVTIPVCQSP